MNKKKRKTKITSMRNERGDITTDSVDMKKITREYQEQIVPINLTTQVKWINSFKKKITHSKADSRKIDILGMDSVGCTTM